MFILKKFESFYFRILFSHSLNSEQWLEINQHFNIRKTPARRFSNSYPPYKIPKDISKLSINTSSKDFYQKPNF